MTYDSSFFPLQNVTLLYTLYKRHMVIVRSTIYNDNLSFLDHGYTHTHITVIITAVNLESNIPLLRAHLFSRSMHIMVGGF